MIDNFELIKPLFYFDEKDNMFFHCQIVQRGKDNKPNKTIRVYTIRSKEHLESLKEEIILLCEHYGARAYINVAGKDFESVNKLVLYTLANAVYSNNISNINPKKMVNSASGEVKSKRPKWVIDIDDMSLKEDVKNYLLSLYAEECKADVEVIKAFIHDLIYAEIPTVNGCHLIVRPFNNLGFKNKFPDVTILRNNGTLLYYPRSLGAPKYCCSICGGTNIQIQAWIDPITNRYIEGTEDDECWCENCGKHTKIKLVNEIN